MNDSEIQSVLRAAEVHCQQKKAKLTPSRRLILSLVLQHKEDVIKAYDILDDLRKIKKTAAPPTVYRALDFLVSVGILHRADALNGYIFCQHFHQNHVSIIVNCTSCGRIEEILAENIREQLVNFCTKNGFALEMAAPVVFSGICRHCQS